MKTVACSAPWHDLQGWVGIKTTYYLLTLPHNYRFYSLFPILYPNCSLFYIPTILYCYLLYTPTVPYCYLFYIPTVPHSYHFYTQLFPTAINSISKLFPWLSFYVQVWHNKILPYGHESSVQVLMHPNYHSHTCTHEHSMHKTEWNVDGSRQKEKTSAIIHNTCSDYPSLPVHPPAPIFLYLLHRAVVAILGNAVLWGGRLTE